MKPLNSFMVVGLFAFVAFNCFFSNVFVISDKCSSFGGCKGLSLVSRLTVEQLGWKQGTMCTSLWGWKDPRNSRKYIVLTCEPGQSIIDVTDESNPRAVAKLMGHAGGNFRWRDVKIYKDHAFFVSDALLSRVQVLDLKQAVGGSDRRLRSGDDSLEDDDASVVDLEYSQNITDNEVGNENQNENELTSEDVVEISGDNRKFASNVRDVKSSAIYQGGGLYQSHNIEINVDSGFAYAVGGGNNCKNGLHMINIQNPKDPQFAGCFYDIQNQYIHDAHCVSYTKEHLGGKYAGREICFGFAVFHLLIIDVTNKKDPKLLSRLTWPNAAYIHQGWLTTDRAFLVIDDERDEPGEGIKTFVADVRDLNNPRLGHVHVAVGETFGDHNQYVLKVGSHDYTFQANYAGGVRVLRINRGPVKGQSDDEVLSMEEVAFFDTNKKNNNDMEGVWSLYPYFDDLVITADMDNGFFILRRTFEDSSPAIPYKTNGKTPSPTVWSNCETFKDSKTCNNHVACVWDVDWVQTKGWFWGCYNSLTVKPTKPYRAPPGGAQGCGRLPKEQCNMYPACIFRGRCSAYGS